jgi:hypothetical protein
LARLDNLNPFEMSSGLFALPSRHSNWRGFNKGITMGPAAKKIESPAWQNPAPGNEQNDSVKGPSNQTIKTGGNSRSAEDDLDLDKHPYRDDSFGEEESPQDFNEDPDEQSDK